MHTEAAQPVPAWSPLKIKVFRSLWIAVLVSNIGTWMHTVGAQWILVHEPGATALVALVQTAETLPVLLLALPTGVLAEYLNRRYMLIGIQAFQVLVAGTLTIVTATVGASPFLILAFTFALGAGSAAQISIYQAVVAEIVPRPQLPPAAALASISLNIARAVGPAVAGVAIALTGPVSVFALNTLTFLFFLVVLMSWRDYEPVRGPREPFFTALRAGGRYVADSIPTRRIMWRLAIFIIPGNAMWALLPIVAAEKLHFGSSGYGLLLGALGGGAVIGAAVLPSIRARISLNKLLALSSVPFAGLLFVAAVAPNVYVIVPLLVISGAAWITVLSSLSAAIQVSLPPWVRARGLSIYQLVLYGSLAGGAAIWGVVAQFSGLAVALLVAGALLLLAIFGAKIWPIVNVGGVDGVKGADPEAVALVLPE
jgi:MFS family permease